MNDFWPVYSSSKPGFRMCSSGVEVMQGCPWFLHVATDCVESCDNLHQCWKRWGFVCRHSRNLQSDLYLLQFVCYWHPTERLHKERKLHFVCLRSWHVHTHTWYCIRFKIITHTVKNHLRKLDLILQGLLFNCVWTCNEILLNTKIVAYFNISTLQNAVCVCVCAERCFCKLYW